MKKSIQALLGLFALAAIALAFTLPVNTDALKVGEKAPSFKLQNAIDGEWYSYSPETIAKDENVKGYTVIFTCNTCPIARIYEQRIIELHEQLAPKGYPVVAIQPNYEAYKSGDGESDSMADMKKRAQKNGYPFVYLLDNGQKIYPQYGATRTPEVFLLDKDFILRYHGAIDDNRDAPEQASHHYVIEAVDALEQGKQPGITETKAVGCSIKVKNS